MIKDVEARGDLFAQKFQAITILDAHAAKCNGSAWRAEDEFKHDGEVYAIVYDAEEDEYSTSMLSKNDLFSAFEVFFRNEEDAEDFIKEHSDVLDVLFQEVKNEFNPKDAIKKAALYLIEETGSATTLDIRKLLRENGHDLKQTEVSEAMQEILHEEKLKVSAENTNGKSHLRFYK